MAGGLFPNYPFELNIKCIIFSVIIMAIYLYKPPEMHPVWKSFTLIIIFIVSYVAMAWYDYKFNCTKLALRKSTAGITDLMKPEPHSEAQTDRSKATKEEKDLEWQLINLYHIFILTPLLLYIGIYKNEANPIAGNILSANLVFAILYHGVRLFDKLNFVSIGHVLIGIIGLYYLNIKDKPDALYTTLIITGLYTGVKHGYYLMSSFH